MSAIATKPQTYFVQTYGCAMNYSDTERLENMLASLGIRKQGRMETADLIIFNTCSIRQHAEDRALGNLKKVNGWKKSRPHLLVGFTGCMVRNSSTRNSAEQDPLVKNIDQLDFALRIEDMAKFGEMLQELVPAYEIPDTSEAELRDYFLVNPKRSSAAQVFIPIGTGCDKYCFYCIVPYTRGRERSRPMQDIVREAEKAVENGAIEITLIGQTVNSYGLSALDKASGNFDYSKPPFVQLIAKLDLLKLKGLKRVRWTSPYIPDLSDELIEAIAALPTQMPYIHLPIQSGDNRTLKRMNRKYTVELYRSVVEKLRKRIPDIAISTDIIVGYSGETEEEFENTCNLYREMQWDNCYLAQYSQRKGTFASKFLKDDIPKHVKAMRWHRLNKIMGEIALEKNQRFVGKTVRVLVENQKDEVCSGKSEHFKNVEFRAGRNLIGTIVPVKITEAKEWILSGEMAGLPKII